jgi:ribose transport system ATP-binding protein
MDEIYEICDRVTVLRDGQVVHTGELSDFSRLQLIAAMLGRELTEAERGTTSFGAKHEAGERPVLRAKGLTSRHLLDDVSVDVRSGEVVGFAGLLGAGRSETARAIFGVEPLDSGEVEVEGKNVKTGSPAAAIKAGVAFLPEDRKADGIIPHLSVRENITSAILPHISPGGLVRERAQDELVQRFIDRLGIKVSNPDQPVGELSGGNQQKVLLARWLCLDPKVLILDDPTRGIDVGAKAEVQHLIDELAEEGLGVILISSELEEVIEGSDRVVVLKDGSVVGMLSGDEITEDSVMGMLAEHRSAEGSDE